MSDLFMCRTADLSPCGQYRWLLGRVWDKSRPLCGWIMLNPSTADAEVDDLTIKKCMGFATRWGHGGILVANLFAWRATDPRDLPADLAQAVGSPPAEPFAAVFERCSRVVAGWGGHDVRGRDEAVRVAARQADRLLTSRVVCAVKINHNGTPAHPGRLAYAEGPVVWFDPRKAAA